MSSTYYAPPPSSISAAEGYAGATAAYQNALARYNQQRSGLLRQYGYQGTVDPGTGMMSHVGVDPTNTVGSLQQLLHGQADEDMAAEYAAEDRGVHGGLANQAQTNLHQAHSAASSQLANDLFSNLSNIDASQQGDKNALDAALWQLQQQATQTDIGNGDYNPGDVTVGGGNLGASSVAQALAQAAKAKTVTVGSTKDVNPRIVSLAAQAAAPKPAAPKPVANAYTTGQKKRG